MLDGLYQSVIVFFMSYLLFSPATFNTENGLNVNDNYRIGVYIANAAVIVVNVYILINTYRWDGIMLGVTLFSILLVFFWTGVYTAFTGSFQFYKAAPEVYGTLTFWALTLLVVVICLLPRFLIKSFQKIYKPYDIDIIREQVRQHKFDYLNDVNPGSLLMPQKPDETLADGFHATDSRDPAILRKLDEHLIDDKRPIAPPSTAGGETTRGHNSQQGSDDTMRSLQGGAHTPAEAAGFSSFPSYSRTQVPTRPSYDHDTLFVPGGGAQPALTPAKTNTSSVYTPYNVSPGLVASEGMPFERPSPSRERPRPSFDRMRSSMDQLRPSFESSHDMTSAAGLMRIENSQGIPRAGSSRLR